MADNIQCWKCGAHIETEIHRSTECKSCSADLKVCVMCQFFNPSMSDHCDESAADYVSEIKRANFCDYFKAKANAFQQTDSSEKDRAQQELNALFGIANETDTSNSNEELEALFKKD